MLASLDIKRNYYALIIIEMGEGKITQNELAAELDTDKVSVVRVVDYLTSKNYIKRVRSASDKRKYCLVLTEKAQKALPLIKNAISDTTDKAFDGLTLQQREEFLRLLSIIKSNLTSSKP